MKIDIKLDGIKQAEAGDKVKQDNNLNNDVTKQPVANNEAATEQPSVIAHHVNDLVQLANAEPASADTEAKMEQIKSQIKAGTYRVDLDKLSEKIAHQLIGNIG